MDEIPFVLVISKKGLVSLDKKILTSKIGSNFSILRIYFSLKQVLVRYRPRFFDQGGHQECMHLVEMGIFSLYHVITSTPIYSRSILSFTNIFLWY